MGYWTQPRYTIEPLMELAEAVLGPDPSVPDTADLFGVADRTVQRWRAGETTITERLADQIAVRIGTHVALIWPEYWAHAPVEEVAA